ncbi:hypothetical protein LCGC14_1127740 [marine sediment metagenome]|uniref:Uncharacterized protein n=1 Tax=marine sediment metagenome TaxID=412755 RepID=A0A0F9Q7V5_9ZZZZ
MRSYLGLIQGLKEKNHIFKRRLQAPSIEQALRLLVIGWGTTRDKEDYNSADLGPTWTEEGDLYWVGRDYDYEVSDLAYLDKR